jgi:hypothetical protein
MIFLVRLLAGVIMGLLGGYNQIKKILNDRED